jgi:hypothetical protein
MTNRVGKFNKSLANGYAVSDRLLAVYNWHVNTNYFIDLVSESAPDISESVTK